MPKVTANTITMNYDQQGTGEPPILIPYLAADHACYAFQVPEYARHFTTISVDLRGTGESDKPQGAYTTELLPTTSKDAPRTMTAVPSSMPTPTSAGRSMTALIRRLSRCRLRKC